MVHRTKPKSSQYTFHVQYQEYDADYAATFYKNIDHGGRRFTLGDVASPNPRPNLMYEWQGFAPPQKGWRYARETMDQLYAEGKVVFTETMRPRRKRFLDEMPGSPVGNVWDDIKLVQSQSRERLGYPTQKPVALLECVIAMSTNEGDIVLDTYCGCGTALVAAHALRRRWLGVDVTRVATGVMKTRRNYNMTQKEMSERFEKEQDLYDAWGSKVTEVVLEKTQTLFPTIALENYFKVKPHHRIKSVVSLIGKAYSRGWRYNDAYAEITDKVGTRFVVLLLEHIAPLRQIIEDCDLWRWEVSRDFEEERAKNPAIFSYQSIHFIVYANSEVRVGDVVVPYNTPCEIQIRTLMQHAYSEMSHDTVYKPSVLGTPTIHRALAKSMALIETCDEIFNEANRMITKIHTGATNVLQQLDELYREVVRIEPRNDLKSNAYLLGALHSDIQTIDVNAIRAFLTSNRSLGDRIRGNAQDKAVFQLSGVLFAYYFTSNRRNDARRKWPLPEDDLQPIYTDLGFAFDR